jgi:hypothetical protein
MSKRKIDDLPSALLEKPLPPAGAVDIVAALPPGVIEIEIPVADFPADCYLSRHVQAQLDATQRIGLRRLSAGLAATDARLKNGRPVKSKADAIRWLLERLVPLAFVGERVQSPESRVESRESRAS